MNVKLTALAATLLLATAASAKPLQFEGTPKDIALANPKAIAAHLQRTGEVHKNANKAQIDLAVRGYIKSHTDGLGQPSYRINAAGKTVTVSEGKQLGEKRAKQMSAAATTVKVLAVLIDFPDLKYNDNHLTSGMTQMYYPSYPVSHFQDLMFSSTGFTGPSGQNLLSANQYYTAESGASFNFTGQAYGWVTADKNAIEYGGHEGDNKDKGAQALIIEAVNKAVAANAINLAQYDLTDLDDIDRDGNFNEPNGIIDHVMVYHSSVGEEAGGGFLGDNAIWSHSYNAANSPVSIGSTGFKLYNYTVQPIDAAAGVVAHEFGHDLGLPDEYDIEYSGDGEPVGNWSIMSGGSWAGTLGGSKPTGFSAWCRDYFQTRYGGDWINQSVLTIDGLKAASSTTNLVASVNHTASTVNQVRVDLPIYQFKPFAGTGQYYSGMGDNLNNSLSFTTTLPNTTTVTLSAKAHWDIELDYDYVQVRVNGTAIAGNYTTANNPLPDFGSVHNYLTADSRTLAGATGADGWVGLTYDLSAYKNQSVTISVAYVTDGGLIKRGFAIDNIEVSGTSTTYSDDAETTKATLAGFTRVNTYVGGQQQYFVQLRSSSGNDAGLGEEGYNPGVLLWFADSEYADNVVRSHPGHGFNGVVDADQALIGSTSSTSRLIRDATFGRNAQTSFSGDTSLTAISQFDDTNDYFNETRPDAGLYLPGLGLRMNVSAHAVDSATATIELSMTTQALAASFSTVKNALTVNFTASANGGTAPYSYLWDFGDDTATSTQANPSHSYSDEGSYTVSLRVTDNSGTVVNSTQTVVVSVPALVTSFTATNSLLTTSFAAVVSGGVEDYTYAWTFGDGFTSELANPSHTYANPGTYSVTLTVTDARHTVQANTQSITVSIPAMVVSFTEAKTNLAVNFSASVSGGMPGYTYAWNFGESASTSNTATGASASHTYAAAGTYTVMLTATDARGTAVVSSRSITVAAASSGGGGGGSVELFGLALLALGLARKRMR